MLLNVIFYVFSGLTVGAAFFAVMQRNPVRGVLFLVLSFFGAAVLWMLMEAEFLALILILVYVGAVMTLFLFVVMMLNIDTETMKKSFKRYLPWAILGFLLFLGLLLQVLPEHTAHAVATEASAVSNTEALGLVLYTDDILAFELAAMILLVAIIAAITLTHRTPRAGKRQEIVKQLMIEPKARVTLVSMAAEKAGEK